MTNWMIGALIAHAPAMFCQSTRLTFEVASVKPADPGIRVAAAMIPSPGGRFDFVNYTVRDLIRESYGVKYDQLSGSPGWLGTDRFTIVAKAQDGLGRLQLMLMLQTLLADRFRLTAHRKTSEGPIYALVVGKNGPKIANAKGGDASQISLQRVGPADHTATGWRMTGRAASMMLLADRLTDGLDRPVIDRTGLEGVFDFTLEYADDRNDAAQSSGASIFTSIQEQLGLKLQPEKGPRETLVIDHVERPSPD